MNDEKFQNIVLSELRGLKEEINGVKTDFRKELKEEINGVKTDFRKELKEEINGVKIELGKEIKGVETGLKEEIKGVETGLKKEIKGVETGLKKEINEIKQKVEGIEKSQESMRTRQDEIYQVVRAIEHSNQVGKSELDSHNIRIAKVEGKIKKVAKAFNEEDDVGKVSNL